MSPKFSPEAEDMSWRPEAPEAENEQNAEAKRQKLQSLDLRLSEIIRFLNDKEKINKFKFQINAYKQEQAGQGNIFNIDVLKNLQIIQSNIHEVMDWIKIHEDKLVFDSSFMDRTGNFEGKCLGMVEAIINGSSAKVGSYSGAIEEDIMDFKNYLNNFLLKEDFRNRELSAH